MKRLTAALLLALVALIVTAVSAQAFTYHYVRKVVTWGSDSTSFYIPSGASVGIKNSDIISLPDNTYWPAPADSIPQFIVIGSISAAGAATDTLMLDYQWTYNGTNFIPALDWDTDAQVHVGTGTYFTFRYIGTSGVQPAYTAGGTGDWAAGVPNTYRLTIPAKGARGFRLVVHPSHAARTLNGKLHCEVLIPVLVP